jgi:hypothetical protein
MRLISSIVAILIFLSSCQVKADHKPKSIRENKHAQNPQPGKDDTLLVKEESIVFIEQDSMQIETRKKQIGESDFQIGYDDYAFYINEAYTYFTSKGLVVTETKGKKFVKFLKKDGTFNVVNITMLEDLWLFYFFSPEKEPQRVDMVIIEEEYKKYFNKKDE